MSTRSLVVLLFFTLSIIWVYGEPKVPCYFIFGDSLNDNGNNNGILTNAKVNYLPYGIDFPDNSTGRFSNGRTYPDFIAEFLGFDHYIPSFASVKDQCILTGANYASGGAGIRDETGSNLGSVISMNKQLLNHQSTVSRIVRILGDQESAKKHLGECIYTVGFGANDYINNYLMSKVYNTSHLFTPKQYASELTQQYSQQLQTLYNNGARKVALFGVGLVGCTPSSIAMYGTNGSYCVDFINNAVELFNAKFPSLVDDLNKNNKDAKFIYVNSSGISRTTPVTGFKVIDTPCCEVQAMNKGSQLCTPSSTPCLNRSDHIWWDAVHPTEAAIALGANRSYISQSQYDAYPIDIQCLAQLNLTIA